MNLLKAVVVSFITLSSTSAFAADTSGNQYVDWSGFYGGIQGGLQGMRDRWSASTDTGFNFVNGTASQSVFFGGIHLGYNHQVGKFVLGVEGDIETSAGSWTFKKARPASAGLFAGTVYSSEAESNLQGSLRARIGVPVDSVLIYGTAGLALADVTHSYGDTSWTGVPLWENNSHKFNDLMLGYTVGAGVEYAVNEKISTRIEYRFTDFGRTTNYNFGWNENDRQDLSSHAIRFAISYHF